MRYTFEFYIGSDMHTIEMQPNNVREVDKDSIIVLSSFFPELFQYKTEYKLLEKVIEKNSVKYKLTKHYQHGLSANNRVSEPTCKDYNQPPGEGDILQEIN